MIRGDIISHHEEYDGFIWRLRQDFPEKAKKVAPGSGAAEVDQYFDAHDIAHYGLDYLTSVIKQLGEENATYEADLAKWVEVWRDKHETTFWDMTQNPTVHEVFSALDLEAHDEEWLAEALKCIWRLRDLHEENCTLNQATERRSLILTMPLAADQPTHAQRPDRGNFHSDPERWVSEAMNDDTASNLTQVVPRNVIANVVEGNPTSQIHSGSVSAGHAAVIP